MDQQINQFNSGKSNGPVIILSLLLIASIVVSGVLLWQERASKKRISSLEQQLESKNQNSNGLVTPPPSVSDSRELISSTTPYTQKQILDTFLPEEWNYSPATTTIIYRNEYTGVEIGVPFNPLWGTKKHRISPYEITDDGIKFGSMMICGEGAGCLARQYYLSFREARAADEEIKDLKQQNSNDIVTQKMSIGTRTVVQYEVEGLCGATGFIIEGKRANFDLSGVCGLSEDGKKELKGIIESMKIF